MKEGLSMALMCNEHCLIALLASSFITVASFRVNDGILQLQAWLCVHVPKPHLLNFEDDVLHC